MRSIQLKMAIVSVLLFGTVISTSAAEPWLRIETANFELIGNASETDIRNVAGNLERFRTAVARLINPADKGDGTKVRVLVFRDAASFNPFKPKLADGRPDEIATGFFQAGEDASYIAVSAEGGGFEAIYHEYTHYLVSRQFPGVEVPPWINEGLAEYLQSYGVVDSTAVEFGRPQAQHLRLLRQSPLMPWDAFFKLDTFTLSQSGKHSRGVFYAQAWALMSFLINRQQNAADLGSLIQRLSTSSAGRIAGLDIAAIDKGVKDLVARTDQAFVRSRFPSEPVQIAGASATLAEPLKNAYLGELLYLLKDPAADGYLSQALAAEPELPLANATLGLLRLRERKFDDAKRYLEKAAVPAQRNYRVYYYLAYLISREYADEFGGISDISDQAAQKMRDYLAMSLERKPDLAEAHRLIAVVGLVTGVGIDASLASAQRAAALEPSKPEHVLLSARLLLRLERIAEAKAAAERVARMKPDRLQKKDADEIITIANEIERTRSERRISVSVEPDAPKLRILKWKDLTPAEIAKIEEERELSNLNLLLDRPGPTDKVDVGTLTGMACSGGRILYRVVTANGTLRLTGRRFDDLKLRVLTQGTRTFAFRCDGGFPSEKVAVRYRPGERRGDSDGVLLSVAFVPKNFRLKPLDEIAREPLVIIEGRPASDLNSNATTAAAEQAEMDRVLREQQLRDIQERLRIPEEGETRVIATPESIVCADGILTLKTKGATGPLYFQFPITGKIVVNSFTPETGIIDLTCRSTPPPVPAVFTYKSSPAKDGKLSLAAIEFVPGSFRLK